MLPFAGRLSQHSTVNGARPSTRLRGDGFDQQADHAAWSVRMVQVVTYVDVALVEQAAGGVAAIGLFGHSEADDRGRRCAKRIHQRRRLLRPHQHLADAADDGDTLLGAALVQRIETVLRLQGIACVRTAQARRGDAPAQIPGRQHRISVDGLVGAVKGADAEMHDAASQRRTVVARADDAGGQKRQGRVGEPLHARGDVPWVAGRSGNGAGPGRHLQRASEHSRSKQMADTKTLRCRLVLEQL